MTAEAACGNRVSRDLTAVPQFEHYRLRNQTGAGRDGVRYSAVDERTGAEVDLVALQASAGDSASSQGLTKRLRLAGMLSHPSARRVLDLRLDGDPPFLTLEATAGRPLAELETPGEAVTATLTLASGLAEGHRLGLVHGRLGPGVISGGTAERLKIDWTGLDLGEPAGQAAVAPAAAGRHGGRGPSPADDVFALGALIRGWAAGRRSPPVVATGLDPELDEVIGSMLLDDPDARPTAARVVERLSGLDRVVNANRTAALSATGWSALSGRTAPGAGDDGPPGRDGAIPPRLGRFALAEKLGEGGMAVVYRGEDTADGTTVAVKVLRGAWVQRPEAVKRLAKEARLLSEVNTPHVTNLIELNEDGGVHYLVLEYVRGTSLGRWVEERGPLDERTALGVVADVARGLAVAHARGIIHRDIKPENVLVLDAGPGAAPGVKLSDFGLARHVEESESLLLTRDGAILGTPLYMSPEQSTGSDPVGPASDIYSLGATLFHLLTGRPPFLGGSAFELITRLRSEPAPAVSDLNPSVSDGAGQVVARALAKRPGERYADAGEMLGDLERLLRGEPTSLVVHPVRPPCDPRDLVELAFQWELEASPARLWPFVANTERLNRALGLPPAAFRTEFDPEEGVKRFGRFKAAGMNVSWREHPYEWVEGRRMGVLREFSEGPFRWFTSAVELTPRADGGTTLRQTIRIAARGWLGRLVARVKIGRQGRRSMERVYRRMDAALTGKLGRDPLTDPFEPPPPLSDDRRRRLARWVESLGREGVEPVTAERVGDFLELAPPQEVSRIRPLALARRLGLDPDGVVAACLHGARGGAMVLLWDILCPVCRVPSSVVDSLTLLREHGHCEACHLDFEMDFGRSVELIFRAHPEVRDADPGTYCIGGPAHSPHVAAQVRVGAGERLVLSLSLGEGRYRLRGPQLAFSVDFRVEPAGAIRDWEVSLSRPPGRGDPETLGVGSQRIGLTNDTGREVLIRLERVAPRDDALTAARASAMPLFRALFPTETLAAGRFVGMEAVTLVVTELDGAEDLYLGLGDAGAFTVVHEQFRALSACLAGHGGAPVKTVGEGIVAAFPDPVSAVRGALGLSTALAASEPTRGLRLRVGVHRGPAMVATVNDHLDYFGTTARVAARLPGLAGPGEVVLSPAVASDPGAAALIQALGLDLAVTAVTLPGLPEGFVHRVTPRT